jgi:hypothetical protein
MLERALESENEIIQVGEAKAKTLYVPTPNSTSTVCPDATE